MNQNSVAKNKRPVVSIITVVYNSEKLIESTILSIINQTYPAIEFIIVDGGSVDKTIDIIKKHEKFITRWISEKDKGLYDAMNKGLEMATGDYVWFINSGDRIYSNDTLSIIVQSIQSLPDVIYGETEIIDANGNSLGMRRHAAPEKLIWKNLINGMLVCHQSVIVKKEIAIKYDLKFKYSSDYNWLVHILKTAKTIFNSKQILSRFLEGGQTSRSLLPGLKERFRIMKFYFGLIPTIIAHFKLAFRLAIFYFKNRRI